VSDPSAPLPPLTRASASAEDARRREIERILAMTPRERAMLALRLGQRSREYAALVTTTR